MSIASENMVCVIIGASHAGVNCAFALRREGWKGKIILYDIDKNFPYHRPPLSKTYLTSEEGTEQRLLFPKENYKTDNITLKLGIAVNTVKRKKNTISLSDGSSQTYDKLVIATGARPFIPPIQGIDMANNVFPMRTADDAVNIRNTINNSLYKRAVIIGGGYIGLETAASLKKRGAHVTVIEREERVLARVTAAEMSEFFTKLHLRNGVEIHTNKHVISIKRKGNYSVVACDDGTKLNADLIVVGVGITLNTELAQNAGLDIDNGIKVDETTRTNDANIFAIGDCTNHYNPHYKYHLRLESVQNAIEQAKTAAKAICNQKVIYDIIPWFWSDQFDIKLQIIGLSKGYNNIIIRKEGGKNSFSMWYFKDDELLAVNAVNFAKAFVLGAKLIKSKQKIDQMKLTDVSIPFKPNSFLA